MIWNETDGTYEFSYALGASWLNIPNRIDPGHRPFSVETHSVRRRVWAGPVERSENSAWLISGAAVYSRRDWYKTMSRP